MLCVTASVVTSLPPMVGRELALVVDSTTPYSVSARPGANSTSAPTRAVVVPMVMFSGLLKRTFGASTNAERCAMQPEDSLETIPLPSTSLAPLATRTGAARSVVLPSPSWLTSLRPQAATAPSEQSTRLCSAPAATLCTVLPLSVPDVETSRGRLLSPPPLPSCPLALSPQATALPSARTPTVWALPAATETRRVFQPLTALPPVAETATGR